MRKGCLTGPATLDALALLAGAQALCGMKLVQGAGRLEGADTAFSGTGILLRTPEGYRSIF